MRLLSLSLVVAVAGVAGGPAKDPLPPLPPMPKDPKDPKDPIDCDSVLGDFRSARDTCLGELGLSGWILPVETAAPVTSAPITSSPTGTAAPVTGAPITSAPITSSPTGTLAPVTSSPITGSPTGTASPVTPAPPTPTLVQTSCAVGGDCATFMMNVDMWRPQIDWCLRDAAMDEADPMLKEQLMNELRWATDLVNGGCSVNEMMTTCADGPFASLDAAGCPADQTDVDDAVDAVGCCVGSFMRDAMEFDELTDAAGCAGGPFKMPKPCPPPKWKAPKNPPPPAPVGKDKKVGPMIGGIVGGVAGLGAVGYALRRRRSSQQSKTARAEKMEMAPAVVAV